MWLQHQETSVGHTLPAKRTEVHWHWKKLKTRWCSDEHSDIWSKNELKLLNMNVFHCALECTDIWTLGEVFQLHYKRHWHQASGERSRDSAFAECTASCAISIILHMTSLVTTLRWTEPVGRSMRVRTNRLFKSSLLCPYPHLFYHKLLLY